MKKSRYILSLVLTFVLLAGTVIAQQTTLNGSVPTPHFDKEQAYADAVAKGIPANQRLQYVKVQQLEFNNRNNIPNPTPPAIPASQVLHTTIYKNQYNQVYNIQSNNGGVMSPQNQYCPNAGFEQYNFGNWTGSIGTVSNGGSGAQYPIYNQSSATIQNGAGNNVGLTNAVNYQTIMTTPPTNSVYPNCAGYDSIACRVIGTQTVSEIPVVNPAGGGVSVRMNGAVANYRACKLDYVMALNPSNKRFSISYAIVLEQAGHTPDDQPYFSVTVKDQNGVLVPGCSIYTVSVGPNTLTQDPLFKQSVISYDALYRPWQTYNFDFTNNPSVTSVTVEFYVGDCSQGGHWGYCYVDAECGLGGALTNYCAGASSALLTAPIGYNTYQWVGPSGNVPVAQGGSTANATVTPVSAGQVFTCNVTSSGGCSAAFTTTISVTTVSVPNVNSTPSCGQGASGSATAYPIGSNQGYVYQWLNSSGATVGSAQTANNLPPGNYTVNVSSPGCGAASGTVTVGVAPPFFTAMNAPFCGSVAWVSTSAGSNYQWYHGTGSSATPISNSQSVTINNPVAGDIYAVTYNNPQGCRDSVNYTLTQVPGGYIYTSGVNGTCPSTTMGTAAINLSTSFSGPYSYTITGSGGYNSTMLNTTAVKDSISGLAAGGYTATVTDGTCQYVTTFSINPIVVSFTAAPSNTTICLGNNVPLSLQFSGSSPTSCGISTSGCSSSNQAQVGTGTASNGTTSYPAPYGNWYTSARQQYLFLASELQAAGISAGKISSISFMVNSINGLTSYPNYNISMKCTSLASLPTTSQFESGLSMVYSVPSYNVMLGWNTHTFQNAYDWDGTSNIIVEVCFAANPFIQSNFTQNCSSPYTPTAFVSSKVALSDSDPMCTGTPNPTGGFFNTYSQRPNAKFGFCSGSINPALLTYNWTPATYLNNPTIQNPVSTPSTNITYTVNAYLTGAASCSATSTSTINVTIPVTPTITPAGPVCNNAPSFSLSASPAGGTWTLTAATSTAGVFTPSVAAFGANTVKYTYGATGCLQTSTATVNVEQFIPSTITGTINPLCITSNTVNLAPLSQYATGTWGGTGVTGTTFNPAAAGAGSFVLSYTTTSAPTASLCPSTSTLAVSVSSVQQPTITPAGPYCSNFAPQAMTVTPSAGGMWSGTGISPTGLFTPATASIGGNTLLYTVTSGPCTATASSVVNVEQYVPATLTGGAGPFCIYDPMANLQPLAINAGGTWSGTGVTGTNFTPSMAGAGTFTLQYHTESANTPSLCPDNSYLVITVNPKPEVNALSDKQDGCNYPLNVSFYTSSTNTGTGLWDFGNGRQTAGLSASCTYSTAGSYQATFYYTDNNGCKDTTDVSYLVNVFAVPDAQFDASPDITTIIASEITCTNHTSNLNSNTYEWSFGNFFYSTDVNPVYTFLETGMFDITLIATSPDGCKDTAVMKVTINPDVVLYVPNAFTPGNHDGLNDEFKINLPPTGVDFSTVLIQVFDRWGELIFQTKDVNTGWKGSKNNSGDLLKEDVYVWKVTFKDNDKKYYEKLGQITLVR